MGRDKAMVIRFFDFSRFHGKNPQGSTLLRVHQVIKHWPEADHYKYGENPDVMVFQKVYMALDYQFPAHIKGIKILDICDPDWLEEAAIVETCNAMDAVTVPSQALKDFISQFHDNVVVIPDRFDLSVIPSPKKHSGKAETVVWFGYAHNAELLRPAMPLIDELGLKLIVIANDDPFPHRFSKRHENFQDWYTFIKYNEETIYTDLQKADFAVLPDGFRPQDVFKSNNKTIKAILAGLPVAKDKDEVNKYMNGSIRQSFIDNNYANIQSEYDVRKSVEQYKEIIDEVTAKRHKA